LDRLFSQEPGLKPGALCISGNGPTLVPVTGDGTVLEPLHWHERRETGPSPPLGPPPVSKPRSLFLSHAAWFLKERPRDYERTRCFFSSQEWLSHRLGGAPVTVLPAAAYGPYYWDEDQCRALGLDPAKFPPFARLGDLIGRVSATAARRFSLPQGVPIAAGGPDFIMALIGLGALEPGIVCDRAGTSEGLNVCCAAPPAAGELRVLPHVVEGLWNAGALIPASGVLFEWFRALTGQEGRDYESMMEEIVRSPGDSLFFPAPGHAPGLFMLPRSAGRAGFGRAVVEAIGFQVRAALETLARYGFPVREMRLSGGQARNPLWNQLKADMSGCTLLVPEIIDGELAGDAALALMALGDAENLAAASSRVFRVRERVIPNPGAVPAYEERFRAYREFREKFRDLLD
jgi:xylulokinase